MLTLRKEALRHMLTVAGEAITYDGVTIRALVHRQVGDRPFHRVDITVHTDDIIGPPAYLTPVIISGTSYTVMADDTVRPRGGGDRWIIPLSAGQTAPAGPKRGIYGS